MGGRHDRSDRHAAERRLVAGVRAEHYDELLACLRAGPAALRQAAAAAPSPAALVIVGAAARIEQIPLLRVGEILAGQARLSRSPAAPLGPTDDPHRRFAELRARLVELLELADADDRRRTAYHPALECEVGLVHVAALAVAQDQRHVAALRGRTLP